MPEIDAELDALFVVAPEEFTTARDAIVKRLRAEKEKVLAGEVAKLRRPSPAVWALNQVAREQPKAIQSLRTVGSRAAVAQDELLRGGPIEALTAAVHERRDLIAALLSATLTVLRQRGAVNDAVVRDLRSALEVASLDEVSGELLEAGRLHELPALSQEPVKRPTPNASPLPTGSGYPALRLVPRYVESDNQPKEDDLLTEQQRNDQKAREIEEAAAAERLRVERANAEEARSAAARNLQLAEESFELAEADVQNHAATTASSEQLVAQTSTEVSAIRNQLAELQARLATLELAKTDEERRYEGSLEHLRSAELIRAERQANRDAARLLLEAAEAVIAALT